MIKDMTESHNLWGSGGYTVNNPAAWTPPALPAGTSVQRYEQTSRPVKRQMSESDECEDVFSEESSKDRSVTIISFFYLHFILRRTCI